MKKSEIAVSASLVPLDYLMVVVAGAVAYFIRFWEPVVEIRPVIFDLSFSQYIKFVYLIALLWPLSFALAGLYQMKGTRRTIDEISKIFLACSTSVMTLMFVFFFSRSLFDSRFIVLVIWFLSIIFIICGRGLVRLIQHFLYRYGVGIHRLIIIGDNDLSRELTDRFQKNKRLGYCVVDYFPDFSDSVAEKLELLSQQDKYDEILVATGSISANKLRELNDFSYLNHITLKYVADIFDFPINNFDINTSAGMPVVELKKTRLDGWGKIYKRLFDIILSLFLIILLSPLMIVVALVIKFDSAGTVFFKYKRIGQQGKKFTYFKFRSMFKDAHKFRNDKNFIKAQEDIRRGSPMVKFKNDPRITRVGKFLRRFSIDELPELFNVLVGKMSIIGPRPHEVEEVAKYKTHHRKVLTIKPGMTGMAQVSGRSDLNFEEEIRLDTWYMENWTPKLDFMILLKTPWAVLKSRKAR